MGRLQDYFFNSLPDYFSTYDSYKVSGKGLLERFLGVLQEEVESYIPDIDELLNSYSPKVIIKRFLGNLASILGFPFVFSYSDINYRALLSNIVDIYKFKGTDIGYKRYFAIWGYDVTVSPGIQNPLPYFDSGVLFDDEAIFDGACAVCYNITVDLTSITANPIDVSDPQVAAEFLLNVYKAMYFLSPINALITDVTLDGNLLDSGLLVDSYGRFLTTYQDLFLASI